MTTKLLDSILCFMIAIVLSVSMNGITVINATPVTTDGGSGTDKTGSVEPEPTEPPTEETTPSAEPESELPAPTEEAAAPPPPEPVTEEVVTVEEEPIDPCLLDPSDPSCPEPVDGKCPEGYNMNEDGQCFPEHDKCPNGYHSHEDDESGRCIPDSTPCDEGYIMNPDYPSCDLNDRVCEEHPEIKECNGSGNGNGNGDNGNNDNDDDKDTIIKNINNIEIIKKTVKHTSGDFDIDLVVLGINDNGDAMMCLIDTDKGKAQCEEFGVPAGRVSGQITEVVEFD